MVLLHRKAVVMAAVEAVVNVEESLNPATDGILVADPDYNVDTSVLERNFTRNDLSPVPFIVGRKIAKATFQTELRGNGIRDGVAGNASILARLFRGSGYSLTAMTAPESTVMFEIDDHVNSDGTKVAWVNADGSLTNTDVIVYYLEVTTGGASGVAGITVTSDTAGEGLAEATVTSESPFTIGTQGLTSTPTFTGDLVAGDRWVVWIFPIGIRLDPVSENFETLTIKCFFDGTSQLMTGGLGTFTVNAQAGQYATIDWEFTGNYFDAVDEALPSPTFETTLPAQVELARLRLDDFDACVDTFTFNQNNEVQIRPCVNDSEGYRGVRIVGRAPEGGVDPEAELVADYDFWGRLGSATRMPFQMRVGTEIGNTVWMISPNAQYTGLTYQDRNGIRAYDAGLRFARYVANDEMAFILV